MDYMTTDTDTIVAIATPPGRGGVGIVRVSGPNVTHIAQVVTTKALTPRYAHYGPLLAADGHTVIDHGIALLFPAPRSFTGEDVLELHAHGGPLLLDTLVNNIVQLDARLARPGEFSERAFLNNKIDLVQAEAIADLINSRSEQAATQALRSLQGVFSHKIHQLVAALTQLRTRIEASIDFPEEAIDELGHLQISDDLQHILNQLQAVFQQARQGVLLQEGMTVAIAGKPNAGKSSLLNALAGRDSAIVTPVAGTTRDTVRETITIESVPIHVIDTAGLRKSNDPIEQEGIRRAWQAIEQADHILLVVDSQQSQATSPTALWPECAHRLNRYDHVTVIHNKCDTSGIDSGMVSDHPPVIGLSAKTGDGIDALCQHLLHSMGYHAGEGEFIARRRHLQALERAEQALLHGQQQWLSHAGSELLAEDLRQCQHRLGEITGAVSVDDLLGEIFANFCMGK